MRPTWKALKFRGSTVLAGTYWLVNQSETQMTFTVNAPFQAVKKQTTHQKKPQPKPQNKKPTSTHSPKKTQHTDLPLEKCK